MSNLVLTKQKEVIGIDSRDVAKMVKKQHSTLLRDIRTYIDQMNEANLESTDPNTKLYPADYFVESTYLDGNGQERPKYDITKIGCDFIANKLTGVKGTAFTAMYTKKFNEMEQLQIRPTDQLEVAAIMIQELKSQRDRLNIVEGAVTDIQGKFEAVKDVLAPEAETWNEMIHKYMGKIVEHTGDYYGAWAESYRELGRMGFDVRRRHENAKKRMAEQGCTKAVIKALTKLQVIEQDKKARQAYTSIVQEMVLRYVI